MSDPNIKLKWEVRAPYTERIDDEVWERWRMLILFLHQNRVFRRDMLRILRVCREALPSEAQLGRKLEVWGLIVYRRRGQSQVDTTVQTSVPTGSLPLLHNSILKFDRGQLKHVSTDTENGTEAMRALIRDSCEPDDDLKEMVSFISESVGTNAHVVLADVANLLYACEMLYEARYIFCASYERLISQTAIDYMSLAARERDLIRVSTSFKEHQIILKGKRLFKLTLEGEGCMDNFSPKCSAPLKIVRDDIKAAKGTPLNVDPQRLENSLPSNTLSPDSKRWMLRHSDLNWNWSAPEHPFRVVEAAGILKSWIEDIQFESGRAWVILRDCLKLLQDWNQTAENPLGKYVSDIGSSDEFQKDSRMLGCFFVMSYLQRVAVQNSTSATPLTEILRLEKIISFNLTIRLYSVFATWIVESSAEYASGFLSTHPASTLLEATERILSIDPAERALKFLKLDRKIWHNDCYSDNTTLEPELWKRIYIMRTARRMAEVLVHLQEPPQHRFTDPILRKRGRSWVTSTSSYASARSMRELGKKVRVMPTSGELPPDILRLSDRMSDMTIDSRFSFNAVTGYPPSILSFYSQSDLSNSHLPDAHEKPSGSVLVHCIST